MKIIQIIYNLGAGGAERFVVDLSNNLAGKGHDVTICMLLDRNLFNPILIDDICPNVNFHCMNFSQGFSLKKSIQLMNYIKKENPDIVHCHLNVIPYIYLLALTNRHIKFFHTIHNIAEKASGGRLQKYIDRFFYSKRLFYPVTISRECKLSFENYYNFINVRCVNNGREPIVKSDLFGDVQKEMNQYKLDHNTIVFIHLGRCYAQKNQELLIDSFNHLNELGVNFILLILGIGFDTDKGILLKNKACDKIHFLGPKLNVGDYLLNADAFCLSSVFEGLPISLLEAISCGLTPICTSVGGVSDVIQDGKTGYLSPDLTIDSYTKVLLKYVNSPLDRKSQIKYFRENFSMDICADKYLEVFKSVSK